VSRPLVIIFLTVLVNLIGFGIIIPLLPFYAQTFGASPFTIGLLFAAFSLAQLVSSPLLGHWSDSWGRRPVLIVSLIGTVVSFVMLAVAHGLVMLFAARIVDGLSGGNITTARAYIGDIATDENRAKYFGWLGATFGLGFVIGPALSGVFAHISHTAPIWAAAAITAIATLLAWLWLPETVHRVHADVGSPWRALRELGARPGLRRLFAIDFLYWASFSVYQSTFALFGAQRFGFDATHTGYTLAGFGVLGVVVQGMMVGPIVARVGEKRAFVAGLVLTAFSWTATALVYNLPLFLAMLVPSAVGLGLCTPSLVSLVSGAAGRHEQGRVQGAAGALESLGRTVGPVWGNGALQVFGEGAAFTSGAAVLVATAVITSRYHPRPTNTL
jgi:DHA1 family tetracycline resistance protein-like MFS transporter